MKRKLVSLVIITLAVFSFACSSFEKNAYKSIAVTATAVDAARGAYAEAYPILLKEGKITEAQDANIETIYKKYQVAAKGTIAAVRVYEAQKKMKENPSQESVNASLASLKEAAEKFWAILKEFKVIK